MMKAYKLRWFGWIVVSEGRRRSFRTRAEANAFIREERLRVNCRGPAF